MASTYLFLYGLLFLQGVWSAPATSTSSTSSYASLLSNDIKKNLGLFLNNVKSGVGSIATPKIKLGVDVIPGLFTSGIKTASDKMSQLADANKDAFGKVAVGVGRALGGAGVFGSSVASGALNLAGSGLGAINGIVGTGARAGLNLTGNLVNITSTGQKVADTIGNITNFFSNNLGNAMTAAGNTSTAVSNTLSSIIDAFGKNVAQGITSAEQNASNLIDTGAKNIGNGVQNLASAAQENFYNALKAFHKLLTNVESSFKTLSASINAIGTNSTTSSGTASTASTVSSVSTGTSSSTTQA